MPISLKALKARQSQKPFEFAGYEGDTIVMVRRPGDWEKHRRWFVKHHWTARIVIVLTEALLAVLIFLFGLFLGAGL